jgi:hypothetical protein
MRCMRCAVLSLGHIETREVQPVSCRFSPVLNYGSFCYAMGKTSVGGRAHMIAYIIGTDGVGPLSFSKRTILCKSNAQPPSHCNVADL